MLSLYAMEQTILIINGGSSSIKFALYQCTDTFTCTLSGKIERIGQPHTTLTFTDREGKSESQAIEIHDTTHAIDVLNYVLHERINFDQLRAIGHRFVYGMGEQHHTVITDELLSRMRGHMDIDPEHLPLQIAIVDSFKSRHPSLMQVACFDTIFHSDMPRVATILPLPRRYEAIGMRRHGFHGISCSYLLEELRRVDPTRADGKVIILHLGSGASVTALKGGKSFDTTMGFTPSSGIPMSSRSGDVDPGAISFIIKKQGLTGEQLDHLINYESGLLGISETSADMYELLQAEATDVRAKEAVDVFCYEAKKRIGAYAAALGGVETIIFSGGMGEKAPDIRSRICTGLEFLGVHIDEQANQIHSNIISSSTAPVCVRVMHTDEERMIAHFVGEIIRS